MSCQKIISYIKRRWNNQGQGWSTRPLGHHLWSTLCNEIYISVDNLLDVKIFHQFNQAFPQRIVIFIVIVILSSGKFMQCLAVLWTRCIIALSTNLNFSIISKQHIACFVSSARTMVAMAVGGRWGYDSPRLKNAVGYKQCNCDKNRSNRNKNIVEMVRIPWRCCSTW